MQTHATEHEYTKFEPWYLAVASVSRGKIIGERLSLKPYWLAGLSPSEAARLYTLDIDPTAEC